MHVDADATVLFTKSMDAECFSTLWEDKRLLLVDFIHTLSRARVEYTKDLRVETERYLAN